MIDISIKGWALTEANIRRLSVEAKKSRARIVKQLAIWAGQSAIKLTPPAPGKSIKSLPQKYKVRPIERLPGKKRGVKYWDKKAGKWAYFLLARDQKPSKTDPIRRIPGAGAAKAGWLWALKSIGNTPPDRAPQFTYPSGTGRLTQDSATLTNLVRYAPKIGASVPKQALDKAWRRLLGSVWAKEKAKMERTKI